MIDKMEILQETIKNSETQKETDKKNRKILMQLMIFILIFGILALLALKVNAQVRIDEWQGIGFGVQQCQIKDLNFGHVKQTFIPTEDYYLKNIVMELRSVKLAPFTASSTMYITDPGEVNIYGELQIDSNSIPSAYTFYDFDFEDQNIFLEQNKVYEIFFSMDSPGQPGSLWTRSFGNNYPLGGHTCALSGYSGTRDINFEAWGYPQVFTNWNLSIPSAYASTTCTFVHDGVTTTGTCTDPIVDNPASNVWYGLVLFFMMFFGMIFYFKRK